MHCNALHFGTEAGLCGREKVVGLHLMGDAVGHHGAGDLEDDVHQTDASVVVHVHRIALLVQRDDLRGHEALGDVSVEQLVDVAGEGFIAVAQQFLVDLHRNAVVARALPVAHRHHHVLHLKLGDLTVPFLAVLQLAVRVGGQRDRLPVLSVLAPSTCIGDNVRVVSLPHFHHLSRLGDDLASARVPNDEGLAMGPRDALIDVSPEGGRISLAGAHQLSREGEAMVVGDSSQQLATLLQHRLVPLRPLSSLSSLLQDGASFCEKGCLAVVEDAHLALEQLALLQEEALLRDGVQQVFSELLDGGVGAGGGVEARIIGDGREVLQHLLTVDAGSFWSRLALLLQPERRADEEVVRQGFIPAHVNDGLLVVHALLGNEDVVQGGALALTAPLVRNRVSLVGHPQEIDLPLMEPGRDIGGRLVEVSHEDDRRLIAALAELGELVEDVVLDS